MKIGKKKIILVTGGAGFIGSHLIERLAKNSKNRVISLDNYFTGRKENHIKGVEYRRGHTKDIKRHVPERPDIIYHLGEYSRVAESIKEPKKIFDLNIAGTAGVVEFWREKKCKLVYAGSSTKFSKTRPDGIEGRDLSPYTWSKAVNSELIKNYGNWYDLPYAISYFYNVFGPREPIGEYGTVIAIFMNQYLKGEPLTVRLPGTQRRNYTHVDDTVDGLLLVGEKGYGDEYGIGSRKSYSTIEVARLFKTDVIMLPARKTSRPSALVNTEKIKKLGWREKRSLKEYIGEFLKKNSGTKNVK